VGAEPLRAGYTPNELEKLLRISADRIRAMIVRGELGAINTAPTRSGKPRYIILPEHLAALIRARQVAAPPKPAPRRRRQPAGWIDYYPG
jgi:hypothetical protein